VLEVNQEQSQGLPRQNAKGHSQIAAFFDIDNTIMRGTSIYHLARGLFAKGVLKPRDLTDYAITQGKFLFTGKENSSDLAKVANNALAFVQNRTVEELASLAEEIYDEIMSDKLWPGTVRLAAAHREVGHQVWVVSAAPIELAQIIASKLNLTGAVATVSEIVDGRYTGNLESAPMHGEQKAQAVRNLAQKHDIDLAQSFAYSDSQNDIPLLSLVGKPRVVNPDSRLRDFALVNEWPVYDFRREHLKQKYAVPAARSALLLIGAGAGLALAARARSRSKIS